MKIYFKVRCKINYPNLSPQIGQVVESIDHVMRGGSDDYQGILSAIKFNFPLPQSQSKALEPASKETTTTANEQQPEHITLMTNISLFLAFKGPNVTKMKLPFIHEFYSWLEEVAVRAIDEFYDIGIHDRVKAPWKEMETLFDVIAAILPSISKGAVDLEKLDTFVVALLLAFKAFSQATTTTSYEIIVQDLTECLSKFPLFSIDMPETCSYIALNIGHDDL